MAVDVLQAKIRKLKNQTMVCICPTTVSYTHLDVYKRQPKDIAERDILIVDPMLATGGSAAAAIDEMKKRGCKHIKLMVLVAEPEGIAYLQKNDPDVEIYAGALDDHLNEHGYICLLYTSPRAAPDD